MRPWLALILAVLVLSGCGKPKPRELPGGEPDPDTLLVGAYRTDTLESAESRGLLVSLLLDSTLVAVLASDHLDGSPPITDRGAWTLLDDGRVRVTLAPREAAQAPDTIDFVRSGRVLRHEGQRFGSNPFELRRVPRAVPAL